jgi:hypothetical protein
MNKSDLVVIKLDRPRYLRFGHKALKTLTALTNMDITNMDMTNFSLEDLEKCFMLACFRMPVKTVKF